MKMKIIMMKEIITRVKIIITSIAILIIDIHDNKNNKKKQHIAITYVNIKTHDNDTIFS